MKGLSFLHAINGYWKVIQRILDIDGDVVMLAFTGIIVWRIYIRSPIDSGTAACYASAVGLFGYSKVRKP